MLVDDDNKRIIIWMMGIHLPESIIENSFADDDVNRWIKIVTHTHTYIQYDEFTHTKNTRQSSQGYHHHFNNNNKIEYMKKLAKIAYPQF